MAIAMAGLPAAAQSEKYPPGFVWDPIADFGRDRPEQMGIKTKPKFPDMDPEGTGVWWWQYKESPPADGDYTDVEVHMGALDFPPTSPRLEPPWKRYRSTLAQGDRGGYNPVIFDCGRDADGQPLLVFFINSASPDHLAVLTWESPVRGTVKISGDLTLEQEAQFLRSMDWSIDHNSTPSDRGTIASGTLSLSMPSTTLDLPVKVEPGDRIHLVINRTPGAETPHGLVTTNDLTFTLVPE
jgi:hypothetical protein